MWAALHSDRNGTLGRILGAVRACAPKPSYSSIPAAADGGAGGAGRTKSLKNKNTGIDGGTPFTINPKQRLVLCGHSLGGGYALLTALELLAMAPPPSNNTPSNSAKGLKAKSAAAKKRSPSNASASSPTSSMAAFGGDPHSLLPLSFCETPEVVTFGAPMVLVPDGQNHLWRSLASCATLVSKFS